MRPGGSPAVDGAWPADRMAGTTGGWGVLGDASGELALDMAARVLKGGGDALIKVFTVLAFRSIIRDARGHFAKVKLVKPAASRARNPEMYLLAKDFRLV